MDVKQFPAGTVLFHEGDLGDAAYLVKDGTIEISRGSGAGYYVLGEIGENGLFGEMALISDLPRMATAVAKVDSICFVVPRSVFRTQLGGADAFTRALIHALIGHIHSLTEALESLHGHRTPEAEFFFRDADGVYRKKP